MENNIQNQNTTAQVAKKSFFGGLMGSMGVIAGINVFWILSCGVIFLIMLFCCCSVMIIGSSTSPSTTSDTNSLSTPSLTATSSNPTVTTTPSEAVKPTEVKKLVDINQYFNKPMTQVASSLGGKIVKGTGEQVDTITVEKDGYSILVQSTSNKTNSSYIYVTVKNQAKCDKTTYKGLENFDNNLTIVGLTPSLKGNVELYFGRSYAAWTKSYNKDYTVNSGCNSEGYIYLNYGLTKCQSLVNGKLPAGC